MPVEVVREPVRKTVLTIFGTNQNVLVLFQNFLKQFFLQVLLQPLLAFLGLNNTLTAVRKYL